MTFAAFILHHLIRIDDVLKCNHLDEGKYQLTYKTEKKALFSKLPDDVPSGIKTLVEPMLNATVTFANPMTIQIFEDDNKFGFVFLDQAIVATKTIGYSYASTTYRGYLERVHVYKTPIRGKTIYVKGEHNSTVLASYKSGDLSHQKFVDMLHANLKA